MEKCQCGHIHCCHKHPERVEVKNVNEWGILTKFIRKICADCRAWLGDENLRLVVE